MRSNSVPSGILGIGSYLPEKILTNSRLETMVDTSDDWIIKRTGISERRILDTNMPAYEMGVRAAKAAIDDAGIKAGDIDLIIVTTDAPDYLIPSTACIIQDKIGAARAAAFDMNAACSGFIYGMTIARQFIASGTYRYILLIGCEGLSRIVDWEDRNTCILFGDGAGAAVLGPVEEGYGIIGTHIGADGTIGHNITLPCFFTSPEDLQIRPHENKRVIWMDGGEVLKFAVRIMVQATNKVLEDAGLTLDEVKMIIPHQANIRIIEGATKRLRVPEEKVYVNINKYGNISSASIPVALEKVLKNGGIVKGDNIVMVGFGGGLTWGSAVIRWSR